MTWIKCSEQMPMQRPYSMRVLVCTQYGDTGHPTIKMAWAMDDVWRQDGMVGGRTLNDDGWITTHWMPLPETPK
jgi:hypothetical protein